MSAPLKLLSIISTCLNFLGGYYTHEFTYGRSNCELDMDHIDDREFHSINLCNLWLLSSAVILDVSSTADPLRATTLSLFWKGTSKSSRAFEFVDGCSPINGIGSGRSDPPGAFCNISVGSVPIL